MIDDDSPNTPRREPNPATDQDTATPDTRLEPEPLPEYDTTDGAYQNIDRIKDIWGESLHGDESPGESIKANIDSDETLPMDHDTHPDTAVESGSDAPPLKITRLSIGDFGDDPDREIHANAINQIDLIAKIGEGGMGTVYRARQNSLDREIAVKRIKDDIAGNRHLVRQFYNEAHITGLLDHPNIVPVHELGMDSDGRVFYAMKLARGTPWSRLLHPDTRNTSSTDQDDVKRHIDILLKVCDAVAFAHSRGIIHRDLKPSNVMVGEYGEVLVLDWGLAVTFLGDRSVTKRLPSIHETRGVCGTPHYMAPEMARAELNKIGTASDVYLLGAMLFEILYHIPPHAGNKVFDVLNAANINEITLPDKIPKASRRYVRVLNSTMMTALSDSPADRQQTADAFAADLRENLQHFDSISTALIARDLFQKLTDSGKPIRDTNTEYAEFGNVIAGLRQALVSWPENRRAMRWLIDAHTAYAELAIQNLDLSLAESQMAAAHEMHSRLNDTADNISKQIADIDSKLESEKRVQHRHTRQVKALQWIAGLLAFGMLAGALAAFWRIYEAREDSRRQAIIATNARKYAEQQTQHARESEKKAKTALEKRLQAERMINNEKWKANWEKYVSKIQRAQSAEENSDIASMRRYLTECPENLRGWEWGRLKRVTHMDIMVFRDHDGPVRALLFRPDGRMLYSAGGNTLYACDLTTGQFTVIGKTASNAEIMSISLSPDSTRIAGATNTQTITLWAIDKSHRPTGSPADSPPPSPFMTLDNQEPAYSVAFNPTDNILAAGSRSGKIRLFDLVNGRIIATYTPHRKRINDIAFSPDGSLILTCSSDNTARLTNASTGKTVAVLEGHTAPVLNGAFSPDGQWIVTGSEDRTARIWTVHAHSRNRSEIRTLVGHSKSIFAVAFDPTSQFVVTTGDVAKVWNRADGKNVLTLKGHDFDVYAATFSPDGSRIATGGWDKTVRIWDATNSGHTQSFRLPARMGNFRKFAVDRTGRFFAITTGKTGMRILDTKTGKSKRAKRSDILCVTASPDGKTFIAGCVNGDMLTGVFATGRIRRHIVGSGHAINAIAVSPDGETVITGGLNSEIRVYNMTTRTERYPPILTENNPIFSLAVDPTGDRFAAGGRDMQVHLYDLKTGRKILALDGHTGVVSSLAYTPDGRFLISGSWDKTIRIWNARNGERLNVLKGHSRAINAISCGLESRRIASASDDLTVRIWDIKMGSELLTLHGHSTAIVDVAFLRNDRKLTSASQDSEIRIWDADRWKPPVGAVSGSNAGNPDAMLELALYYEQNVVHEIDVESSLFKVYKWYRQAVSAGSEKATRLLAVFEKRYMKTILEGSGKGPDERIVTTNGETWQVYSGRWMLTSEDYIGGTSQADGYLFRRRPHPDNVRFTATFKIIDGFHEITMWLDGSWDQTEDDGYSVAVSQQGAKLQRKGVNVLTTLDTVLDDREYHTMTFEMTGGRLRAYLDGDPDPFFDWSDPEPLYVNGNRTLGFYIWMGTQLISNITVEDIAPKK